MLSERQGTNTINGDVDTETRLYQGTLILGSTFASDKWHP